MVAEAHLLGDQLEQNITRARLQFEQLALKGSPKAQMVSNTVYCRRHNCGGLKPN